jgi:outer membrane protein assembly factor BamB
MKSKQNLNSSFSFLIGIIFILFIQACSTNEKSELQISQWRGENRNGIYSHEKILESWPENGPEILWVAEGIGKGYASPAITEQQVFVNGEQDSSSFLFAFDLQGNLQWKAPNGKEFMGEGFSATYPGSRSTPTVVGDLVYTSSGLGRIACFETASGKEKWSVDIVADFEGLPSMFGYSESPLIDENKLFCFPGGNKNNMVALDRFSGEIIWSSDALLDTFSYCSPILVTLPERKILLTHSRHKLYALDCENGEALGSYFIKDYKYDGEHCNSPVYDKGNIYFIGNESECGAVKLSLSENGKQITEVWSNASIKNNFNGYIKMGNNLFTTVKGNWLLKIDIESGAVSDSIKTVTGSLIFSDNKFICYGMNGEVNLISFQNNQLQKQSSFKVMQGNGHHFSHPAVKNGILYIRHGNALIAYKIGV